MPTFEMSNLKPTELIVIVDLVFECFNADNSAKFYFVVKQFTFSFELVRTGLRPDIVIDIQEEIRVAGITDFRSVGLKKFAFLENRDVSRMSQALWLQEKLNRIGLFETNEE